MRLLIGLFLFKEHASKELYQKLKILKFKHPVWIDQWPEILNGKTGIDYLFFFNRN